MNLKTYIQKHQKKKKKKYIYIYIYTCEKEVTVHGVFDPILFVFLTVTNLTKNYMLMLEVSSNIPFN